MRFGGLGGVLIAAMGYKGLSVSSASIAVVAAALVALSAAVAPRAAGQPE